MRGFFFLAWATEQLSVSSFSGSLKFGQQPPHILEILRMAAVHVLAKLAPSAEWRPS
jgi:hypothetical protein